MRTTSFASPSSGRVRYPNSVSFMYSKQPVIVECSGAQTAAVTLTCTSNANKAHTETRSLFEGWAEFNISRVMQNLSRGLDDLLQRLNYESGASLAETFRLQVRVDGVMVLDTSDMQALYGALDASEVYGDKTTRRVFVNYPQSINMWKAALGAYSATFAGVSVSPSFPSGAGHCREESLQDLLSPDALERLRNGLDVAGSISWLYRIQEGTQTQQASRTVILKGDATPRGRGAYLRWINRRGEVSYWRFDKAQLETGGAVGDTFSRYYSGDPAEPVGQVYTNPDKRNYRETRRLALTASQLSEEEFDDLCTLLTSPVVEMLYEAEEYTGLGYILDGGSAASSDYGADVDGADAGASLAGLDGGAAEAVSLYHSAEDRWIRVNVEGGTQQRQTRRPAPRLHDFDIVIALLERNTPKL